MANGTCPIVENGAQCGAPARGSHGLCNKHRLRMQRRGDPLLTRKRAPGVPFGEWFWSKLASPNRDGCREWTMYRDPSGYGRLGAADGTGLRMAHRVAWELTHGPIPDGLVVCHVCDNPPCCAPEHLWLGTKTTNTVDMARKGRARNRYGKIPDPVKDEVRRQLAAGVPGVAIAKSLGISPTSVSAVKRGRSH